MSSAEEPTSTPEQSEPKRGDPISEERQAELQAILDAWNAPVAGHGGSVDHSLGWGSMGRSSPG